MGVCRSCLHVWFGQACTWSLPLRCQQVGRREEPAGFCVGQIELTPSERRQPFLSSSRCHPEKTHPVAPDLSVPGETRNADFHVISDFENWLKYFNSILAKLNMSLAPRVLAFAFMCGLLPSSVSTSKASEGRPRELVTNSMPWQDKTTLFFNTGPASHLCAFSHAVSLSRWLFFSSSSNVIQFSRLSCVPVSHEAFPRQMQFLPRWPSLSMLSIHL